MCETVCELSRTGEHGANRRLGKRTRERIGDLAVPERNDHRDALHAVLGGELLIGVDVDLDEVESAAGVRRDLLEDRSENLTRLTPGGPEIHDNRHFPAALQDVLRVGG